ncbi:protein DPCD-like isoform X2 [Mercenaria mercenaria]|uniref:protein DPCD-like isoform X2 n=1 Tax=Mercenaria mercenaria TaxID=6596 RepID=UPI00234F7EDB|nr:protein DPCD-like isoform X2 [Mercenaria mercenaria]
MAASDGWVDLLKKSQKTCMIQDVRKWKKKSTLGGAGKWEFEVGEQLAPPMLEAQGLMESNTNPIFVRKDTVLSFQWRIRNLPYPLDVYNVTCDPDQNIIIKTSNKKYYKKFRIPDMERCNLPLEQSKLSVAHANNTLIVSYKKPSTILEMEKTLQSEFSKLKANKDGDVDCTPS